MFQKSRGLLLKAVRNEVQVYQHYQRKFSILKRNEDKEEKGGQQPILKRTVEDATPKPET